MSTALNPEPDGESRSTLRPRITEALSGELRAVPIVAVLLVLGGAFASLSPFFLTPRNITVLMLQTVPIAVLALAVIFVLFVAEIDLSLGTMSAVTAATAVTLMVTYHWSLELALLAALLIGGTVGAIQAGIVLLFGPPSFLVTLGGSFVGSGVLVLILPEKSAQISTLGTPLASINDTFLPDWLSWTMVAVGIAVYGLLRLMHYRGLVRHGLRSGIRRHVVLPVAVITTVVVVLVWHMSHYKGVPLTVALLVMLLASAAFLVGQTSFGRHMFAVGGNREGARRAGVKVERVIIAAFVIAGSLAAVSGMAAAARQLSVSASSGGGLLLLSAIAGAVIGGASLFGGRGIVWAALLGPLILGTMQNGFDLLGAPPFLRIISIGTILVLAVILDAVIARGRLLVGRSR